MKKQKRGEGERDAYGPLFSSDSDLQTSIQHPASSIPFLNRPIVFFDLEATGLDTNTDRIVEIALVRLDPDGKEEVWTQRVNPEISIPPEAAAIHGISDHDVKDAPFFKKIAPRVAELFNGADLAGYNLLKFDIPLLARELERAGLSLRMEARRVVDVMKIFQKKESRDLAAAYQFYCKKKLEGHHGAQADAVAAKDIFLAQMEKYPDLPRDVEGLHGYCTATDARFVDNEGKLFWRYGRAHFSFGKYKSRSLEEIARVDRDYLAWLMEAEKTSPELAAICRNALDGQFPQKSP
ncbi:MAG: 3'-5' exonuclease [Elusimicrobia bacterium]|nr:3'-5' exonuclease [Elusimicrobiota bacterium]